MDWYKSKFIFSSIYESGLNPQNTRENIPRSTQQHMQTEIKFYISR